MTGLAGRGAKGVAAGKAALGHATALGAGMLLGKQELCTLRLEAAKEEIGAELQDVVGLVLEDFAVEGGDLVGVVGRERHSRCGAGVRAPAQLFDERRRDDAVVQQASSERPA